jgi:undecaprenyl-diphosphatase
VDLTQALVLGAIQGLTEFIPISSTAHLILAPLFFGIPPPRHAHSFDTIIQVGTLLPVLLYFRRDWAALFRAFLQILRQRHVGRDQDQRMVSFVIIGSIPAAFAGLLLDKHVEKLAQTDKSPIGYLVIGISLAVVGLLMWYVDTMSRKVRTEENLVGADAWFVGIAQAIAIIPGVSRSGATMTAGLVTGLTREAAARFSFYLSMPALAGATAYKLIKLGLDPDPMSQGEWMGMAVATVVAAVVGYICIAWLMAWLKRRSLALFAYYRLGLGAFLIIFYFLQRQG